MVPEKKVERLSHYHKLLDGLEKNGIRNIFSHELARMAGVSAAQVRRDLMILGYKGNPRLGYRVKLLIRHIEKFFEFDEGIEAILVGVGNLGRAFLAFFLQKRPAYNIVLAFDKDPQKIGRLINGCMCHSSEDIPALLKERPVRIAILAVPAQEAQAVADLLVENGIKGILNFAPYKIKVPGDVYVEHLDVRITLEKVSYFAHHPASMKPPRLISP